MKIANLAFALLIVRGTSLLSAQATAPTKQAVLPSEPLIADVHPSPYRPTINYTTNISLHRFDMRHATVLDLIEFAFGLGDQDDDRENAAILGGPTWIDLDRFDITAVIPSLKPFAPRVRPADPANPAMNPLETIRPVLTRVLTERFHLKYHMEDRPLPGYIVTVAAGGAKFAEAKDPTATQDCRGEQDKANLGVVVFTCAAETITQLLSTYSGAFPHPVLDRTGLTKQYDFTLKLLLGQQMHTRDDYARAYTEAFKQLGLVITAEDTPQPALVVDTVDRPTANAPEIVKLIPAPPDLDFEVASIRLAADNEPVTQVRPAASQITFTNFSLQDLLVRAWQLPTGAMLGDAIPLLPKTRFTILAKLPPEIDGRAPSQQDQIAGMLQKLLIDRFQIKYHWGEWTTPDATVLLAGTPRMKRADPKSRSFCKYGPPEGEKDARSAAGSPFDREFHCQNVTMAQFADLLQPLAQSDVKTRVPDKTELAGAYDFTLFYTASRTLRAQTSAAVEEAKQAGGATAAPPAGLGLQDAFRKQLGLRLERQSVTLPALLLDHFEQSPSAN